MNTRFIALFIALLPVQVIAGLGQPSVQRLDKAKAHLNKNKPCALAIATKFEKDTISSPIICMWDGVWRPGTIDEDNSCMLGTYDLATGKYGSLSNSITGIAFPQTVSKKCSKELVRDMVHKFPMKDFSGGFDKISFKKQMLSEGGELIIILDEFKVWDKEK